MAYKPNIPQPADLLSSSQQDIEENFNLANTYFGEDHVAFDASSNQGKHEKSTYVNQGAPPNTTDTEGAIYSRQSTLTTNTEMVFRRQTNGSLIEFTGLLGAVNGWTRLPSGILLKWGTFAVGGGQQSRSFPVAATIPVFSPVLNALVCVEDTSNPPNTFVTLRSVTNTQINVFASSRTTTASSGATFRYLAIGT